MEDLQIPNTSPDFSDIPALGDQPGLEAYLNNQALAAAGVPAAPATSEQPTQPADPAQSAAQPAQPTAPVQQPAQPAASTGETITLTREQLNAILAGRGQTPAAQPSVQRPAQPQKVVYSAQEQAFIANALAQGYSLEQINNYLNSRNLKAGINPALEARVQQVEKYLQDQEYKAAETNFINRITEFGNKWGLSEQDLVTFGNEALKNGINIAMGNVNLEAVFRAVYPEQYAIRSRRMTPTTSSQIYGGTSIPESSRAQTSKIEDAFVENFLRGAMPNQYAASMKK